MGRVLIEAAAIGDMNTVMDLLNGGSEVDVRNEFGVTALMEAAKHGHLDTLSLLLEAGADVNAQDRSGRSALMNAVSSGNAEALVRLLDKGADIDGTDRHGDTALTRATAHLDAMNILLGRGADVNWRNLVGTTALMRAAKYGHVETLRLLIAHGADVDAQNVNGSTALMRASSEGHTAIVQELLRAGVQVDIRDTDGGTALIRAAARGQAETLLILLTAGADAYATDEHEFTALSFAAMFGHETVVKTLLQKQASHPANQLMELLTDDYGDSPLILAARSGHLGVVRLLLDGLAEDLHGHHETERLSQQLNCRNKKGDTALIEAVRQGHYEITQYLLEKGADPRCENLEGETAASVAPLEDDCRLFNLLIEKRAAYISHDMGQGLQLPCKEDQSEAEQGLEKWPTRSRVMRATFSSARDAAETDGSILLLGESGSGKDFLARHIHDHSKRGAGPFRSVNCAALPRELAESELFGHEKGAFTGATQRKRGVFELARGGTVFLNEIGDMPLELQAKLLTFLDTHRFQRVGGEAEIESDARIMAATNKDLTSEVSAGRFRLDLYHRLAVWPIRIPPLRERTEDIPLLTSTLLSDLCTRSGMEVPQVSPAALDKLISHKWEGNIRELRNVLERALILSHGDSIDSGHLLLSQPRETLIWKRTAQRGTKKSCSKPEPRELRAAYEHFIVGLAWSRARLAKHFGVDSSTLKKWFKEAGLPAGKPGRPKKKCVE